MIPALGVALLGTVVRKRLMVITVRGTSMQPTYQDGDRVLVLRWPALAHRRRCVVILSIPDPVGSSLVIKRIVARQGDATPAGIARSEPGQPVPADHIVVLGDGAGVDSRIWGYLSTRQVQGVVVGRVAPPFRADAGAAQPGNFDTGSRSRT